MRPVAIMVGEVEPVPTSFSLDRIPFDVLAFCKLVKEKLNGA